MTVRGVTNSTANWHEREHQLQALVPQRKGIPYPRDVWQAMSDKDRVEACTGRSLDECMDILDLPMELAVTSPCVMNGKVGVIRAVLTCVTKIGLESSRLKSMQQQLLGELIDGFEAEEKKPKR
jgi:hypothetical protein